MLLGRGAINGAIIGAINGAISGAINGAINGAIIGVALKCHYPCYQLAKESIESVAIDQANPSDSSMIPAVPPAVVPDPSANIVADTPWKPVIDIPYLLQQRSHSESRNTATILGGASFSGATTINFNFK